MDNNNNNKPSASEQSKEDWMNAKWRPMMGWTYMATCLFDFIIGPILYNILQFYNPGQAVGMWVPLTLQGGGLYHIAMGAVIGISAYGRTQEKLGGATTVQTTVPQSVPMNVPMNVPMQGNTGGNNFTQGNFAPTPGNFGNDSNVNSASLNPAQPSPISPEAALSASVPKVSPPRIPIV